jgi:probable rRNA maturation factor
MQIEITNLQTHYRIDEPVLERYAHWIMEQVHKLDPSFHWTELSIVLTDDSIREMNRQWFQKDTVTDVISFAYPASAPNDEGDTGEIILNLQQAAEEGKERESPDQELALYLAHGCHHLMGADDATPDEKRAMLDQETDWITQAKALTLCGPFFL